MSLDSRRWRVGRFPGSARSTDLSVAPHIPAAYELACGLGGVGADAEEVVENAILALELPPSVVAEPADLAQRLFQQVMRGSAESKDKPPEEVERLMRAALDRSRQNGPLSPSDAELAGDVMGGVRRLRALRGRRARGRAAMAASVAVLAVVLASSLISSSGESTRRLGPTASSRPQQKPGATIWVQSIPAPTTTGPCQGAGGTFPYGSPTCVMAGAVTGVPYPILWYDHCGVLPWTQFNGVRFYVAALDPTTVDQGLGGGFPNFIPGTMTLTSAHNAVFRDSATGRTVAFTDRLPGQIGSPYPYWLQVYQGWSHVEISFAGRFWTSGVVPLSMIPANVDRSASSSALTIPGALTLTSDVLAEFVNLAGTRLDFTIDYPMCA